MQIQRIHSSEMSRHLRSTIVELCSEAYGCDFWPTLELMGSAVHLLGRDRDRLVTHAAYVDRVLWTPYRSYRTAYVETVATRPSDRGLGHGRAMMGEVVAGLDGYQLAALSPPPIKPCFYAGLGWQAWRGPLAYVEPNDIPRFTKGEQVMIFSLPETGPLPLSALLCCQWRSGKIW